VRKVVFRIEDVRIDIRSQGNFGQETSYRMVHKLTGLEVEGKTKTVEGTTLQEKLIKELQEKVEAK
jgi:hypothetical protein